MLHNARTSAERQMEGKCNSQVEEITRKSYNKELQATNTAEWFTETKLQVLQLRIRHVKIGRERVIHELIGNGGKYRLSDTVALLETNFQGLSTIG